MKDRRIAILAAACVLVTASLACGAVTSSTQEAPPAASLVPAAPTTPPEPAPSEVADLPDLEDDPDAVSRIINSGDSTTLYQLINETGQDGTTTPNAEHYTVDMGSDTQIDLGPGWCTKTAAIRDDNKKHFDPAITINDSSIPDRQLTYYEWKTDDGKFCFSWDIIASNWPVGEHRVTEAYTFDAPINDGWDDYPAGEFTTEYTVTVSEGTTTAPAKDDCVLWDQVTVSMKGETVCFRGVITKFDQSRQLGTRYSFSDKSGTVFIYSIKYEIIDPNTGKTIAPGTCVETLGPHPRGRRTTCCVPGPDHGR